MKLNIVMISRAGSQKNIWDVCSESVESEGYKGDYMSNKVVFSLLVDNEAGVLSRVAGLFSRRGYNIDSLTVGETQDKRHSRMTVVAEGEPEVLEQIEKQLAKLVDVSKIQMLPADASVCRELILIKVAAKPEERAQVIDKKEKQEIIAIADIFRAKIVDVGEESMMVELTGNESKLDACTKLLEKFTILELARTGITGLSRGSENSLS